MTSDGTGEEVVVDQRDTLKQVVVDLHQVLGTAVKSMPD